AGNGKQPGKTFHKLSRVRSTKPRAGVVCNRATPEKIKQNCDLRRLGASLALSGETDLDCGRARLRETFHCARGGNTDCVFGTGKGDSPVRGGFDLVKLHHSL